jgi:hypothetical protein
MHNLAWRWGGREKTDNEAGEAVCHDGVVSERGQISDKMTGTELAETKGAGKEEQDKMAAHDAIYRLRCAPGEEKGGEAWSLEGRQ